MRFWITTILICALLLTLSGLAKGYPDTSEEDVIIDAPWKTIRSHVPVLFFFPEFNRHSPAVKNTVTSISLFNYDRSSLKAGDPIFVDELSRPDVDNCSGKYGAKELSYVDHIGTARNGLGPSVERPDSMFHYVVRVPMACIGFGGQKGKPGRHYIVGRIKWEILRPGPGVGQPPITIRKETYKVMEVLYDQRPLPKFHPDDRYYDIHYHTIAEQTAWDVVNLDAARKAFGGPLVMLAESAYALGLVDVQLSNQNWRDLRNRIVTTDHNVFFSHDHGSEIVGTVPGTNQLISESHHYDAGNPPGFGPTGKTDGSAGEFNWYRENLGELAGEEVSLQTNSRKNEGPYAAHLLAYGAPHFEGPWHGGQLAPHGIISGSENPNTIENVLEAMGQSGGFGYAAHPYAGGHEWGPNLIKAMGLPPFNSNARDAGLLNKSGDDFSFKGEQVWNEKTDYVAHKNLLGPVDDLRFPDRPYDPWSNPVVKKGKGFGSGVFDHIDPFVESGNQSFVQNNNWKNATEKNLENYRRHVASSLTYSFKETPNIRFIRKLYMSAGTDAHGDFNFGTSLETTAEAECDDNILTTGFCGGTGRITSNAFGRVRTYVLASAQPGVNDPIDRAVDAYRNGNAILSDGPICRMSLDADCRLDSSGRYLWTDNPLACEYKNGDGQVGGGGRFGGLRTALVTDNGKYSMLSTDWMGWIDRSAASLDSDQASTNKDWDMRMELAQITSAQAWHGEIPPSLKLPSGAQFRARAMLHLPIGEKFDSKTGFSLLRGYSESQRWFVGDVDGDGREDLINVYGRKNRDGQTRARAMVHLSTGSGFSERSGFSVLQNYSSAQQWFVGDVNGDGRDDLINLYGKSEGNGKSRARTMVHFSTGAGFESKSGFSVLQGYSAAQRWFVGDVNGDGKDDLVNLYGKKESDGRSKARTMVHLSNGAGFAEKSGFSVLQNYSEAQRWLMGDVNGDGKADLINLYGKKESDGLRARTMVHLSTGTGFEEKSGFSILQGLSDNQRWLVGDVNGDGKDDLINLYGKRESNGKSQARAMLHLSTGAGFSAKSSFSVLQGYSEAQRWLVADVGGKGAHGLVNLYGAEVPDPRSKIYDSTTIGSALDADGRGEPFAVYLRGNLKNNDKSVFDDGTCITNPIWIIPASITVARPSRCPIQPGELSVSSRFGASMSSPQSGAGPDKQAEVAIYAVDSRGRATGSPVMLSNLEWSSGGTAPGGAGGAGKDGYIVYSGRLAAKNTEVVPCPADGWDSNSKLADPKGRSYVAIIRNIHDINGNRLNDIGTSFSIEAGQ